MHIMKRDNAAHGSVVFYLHTYAFLYVIPHVLETIQKFFFYNFFFKIPKCTFQECMIWIEFRTVLKCCHR